MELAFIEQTFRQYVGGELYGNFSDVPATAFSLFPYVFQIGTGDEDQIILSNRLTVIPHCSTHSCSASNEIKLEFGMVMYGEVEWWLVAIGQVEAVAVG